MLDKEVCFKCRMNYLKSSATNERYAKVQTQMREERFENEWQATYVSCHFVKSAYNMLSIDELPPHACTYRLEQLVNF